MNLASGLARQGATVFVGCCRRPRGGTLDLLDYARTRGIEPIAELHLDKHFRPFEALLGVREIRQLIHRHRIDIVHTHLPNDHLLGGIAARLESAARPLVIRSNYDEQLSKPSYRTRFSLRYLTDHLVVASHRAAMSSHIRSCVPEERISLIRPGVDTSRFNPDRRLSSTLSIPVPEDSVVAGVVARVQTHRQFGLLLRAFAKAVRREPRLRLVIVGRGTNIDRVAKQPTRELGLEEHVVFTGYLRNDEYVAAIKAFDFQVFLVPGSDGTCRAAREGMAMGKALLVSRRGILPELVAHGECGLVVDELEEELAAGLVQLARDGVLRDRLGASARRRILAKYSLTEQVSLTAALYDRLIENRPG